MTPLLRAYFQHHLRSIDAALRRWLPTPRQRPAVLHEAMRYSVFAGGKRLRPILVIAAAEACGGTASSALPAACAFELVHTYSLIHDDLPCMDDDDLRRGRPTNHIAYGEDIAVLAGDALLTKAFELAALNARYVKDPARTLEVIRLLAEGAGHAGMVGGQVADIKADDGRWRRLSDPQFSKPAQLLSFIHRGKTSALIRSALMAGGALAGAKKRSLIALRQYGDALGLLFQITDDILDQVGDKEKLGKLGSDAKNQKLTFATLYGIDQSRRRAAALVQEAHQSLRIFGRKGQILHELADFVLSRES